MVVLPVSASCVTISNHDSLSSSETGVIPGIRSGKKHSSDWAQCQKAISGIYFTEKWRATTLQPGLGFDKFKPRLESGFFKCISRLNCWFLGCGDRSCSGRGSQDLSNGTGAASKLSSFLTVFTPLVYERTFALWTVSSSGLDSADEYSSDSSIQKSPDNVYKTIPRLGMHFVSLTFPSWSGFDCTSIV
jgi:hypothetical protein